MSPRLTPGRIALIAAVLAVAVYANAPANGFAYDDVAVIQQDTSVHALRHVPGLLVRTYWQDTTLALYRPLTIASFALDWSLSDGSAAWFHLANALWHAAATALAALLIAALFGTAAALAGGVLFALHPVHVEAVANVVGRAELMAAVSVFGASLLWLRLNGARRTVAVCATFALGLLAKESVIALPLLLPLVDLAAGRLRVRAVRGYLREHLLAYGCLALTAAAYLLLRHAVLGGIAPSRVDPALELATGHVGRVLTSLQAWPHYLRLLLYPQQLMADYGPRIIMPVPPLTPGAVLGAIILGGALLWGAIAVLRDRGGAALLLLWVPLAMLPVSNLLIPIGVVVAERLLYVPSFAVAAAFGVLVATCLRVTTPSLRYSLVATACLALAWSAHRTWTRTPDWQSTDHVFASQLVTRGDNFRVHWHRARTLRGGGHEEDALVAYRTAFQLWPYRQGLVNELAQFEAQQGHIQRARELARFGTEHWPSELNLQRLLAATSLDLGDTATATRALRTGLALDSTDAVLRRMQQALSARSSVEKP